ncbi:MAG: FecR domain-containing protein [Pseudomonadota bacterium]
MQSRVPKGRPETLSEEARRLAVRLSLSDATRADFDDATRWRGQSRDHDAAFKEAEALLALGRAVVAQGAVLPVRHDAASAQSHRPEPTPRLGRRRFLASAGLGSAALAAHAAASSLGFVPGWEALLSDHATARGERRDLILASGARVLLDGATTLNITQDSAALSACRLVAGAVLISADLAKDRQVRISAGGRRVEAQDGTFSVQEIAGGIEVAALDGTCRIEGGDTVTLQAASALRYTDSQISAPYPVDPSSIAAWREGDLSFQERALADVAVDLDRHRTGVILFADPALRTRMVSGRFSLADPDRALSQIADGLRIRLRRLPGDIALLG